MYKLIEGSGWYLTGSDPIRKTSPVGKTNVGWLSVEGRLEHGMGVEPMYIGFAGRRVKPLRHPCSIDRLEIDSLAGWFRGFQILINKLMLTRSMVGGKFPICPKSVAYFPVTVTNPQIRGFCYANDMSKCALNASKRVKKSD